jgi:hypothetical protein
MMKKLLGILAVFAAILTFAGISLTSITGCGGGSSPTPTPTPPSTLFPNDQSLAQNPPVKLGTSGGDEPDQSAPGPGGVCCIGTLGSLWTKAGVANPVILSNNHVLGLSDNGKASTTDVISQPKQIACTAQTSPAPISVAHFTQAAALKPIANETTQPCAGDASRAALCGHAPSNVDAAIAQVIAGQVDASGSILDLGPAGTSSIAPAPPSSTIGAPALGEGVGKSGRTTGLTCSTVQSLNTTVLIDYDATCGDKTAAFTAYFTNQLVIAGGTFSAGGDSGSLIVDTASARPVGLLYGGDSVNTVANPIADVINAFGGPAVFTIVGGPDHAVSCAHQATASAAQVGAAQAALVPAERQRVAAVQKARGLSLMRDFGFTSIEVGASGDNPKEGALVLHVAGKSVPAVPPVIDGVRTRLVFDDPGFTAPAISAQQVSQATAVKEAHVDDFLGKGIQAVGVAISSDNPAETAISFYVIQGQAHPVIPATIDGIRTKVIEGTPFRTY